MIAYVVSGYLRLRAFCQTILQKNNGAVLIEFAIVANLIIVINLLAYDYALYFKLKERSQHAIQFIYNGLSRDPDHVVMIADLRRQAEYLDFVQDFGGASDDKALLVVNAIPYYRKDKSDWVFLVCWSWSSNLALTPALSFGEPLPGNEFSITPWIPAAGFSPSSAILIVKAYQKNKFLFDLSPLPDQFEEGVIGPIHSVASRPINLMYYSEAAGTLLNDQTRRENTTAKLIACTR